MSSSPYPAEHGHDAAHGNLSSYMLGFALSIILTLASFWLVMSGKVGQASATVGLVVLCVIQLLVQLIFFLHLGTAKSQRENTLAFLFTLLILGIIVAGSLWVLHNMNVLMMPWMVM